jgi:hypothetical protein
MSEPFQNKSGKSIKKKRNKTNKQTKKTKQNKTNTSKHKGKLQTTPIPLTLIYNIVNSPDLIKKS